MRVENNRPNTVSRKSIFTDMDFGMRVIPSQLDDEKEKGDIAKKRDIEAIKQSCLNILLTNRGEKPFDPDFGSNIRSQLFEIFDPVMKVVFEEEIRLSLRKHEPRVRVLEVEVEDRADLNALDFRVVVEIRSPEPTIEELGFVVERQR